MSKQPANYGKPWTREELILAFELYCTIPFRHTKATQPRVAELARLLDRSPASVARKLGNFGAFDPQLAAKNISGLSHGSKLDREIWNQFHADWNSLVLLAADLRKSWNTHVAKEATAELPSGPSEVVAKSKKRLHQSFFRSAVLSSYNYRCCVTGLPVQECLTAGHIIPWSFDETRRADPRNGVCMSATFDRLFDTGLVTIEDDMTLFASEELRRTKDATISSLIIRYHEQKLLAPTRFFPDPECLKWHRENVFRKS